MFNENLWISYFFFYSFLSVRIVYIFNIFKLFYLNQTFITFNTNLFIKISIFLVLFSLGGLPPFLGFFPKWIIIEILIFNNIYILLLIIVFLTLITLYFYLRISFSSILINHLKINWNFKINYSFLNLRFINLITFFSLFGLILLNLFYYFI